MSPLLCYILFSNCLLLIDRSLFCLGTFLNRSKILSFNNFLFILTFFLFFFCIDTYPFSFNLFLLPFCLNCFLASFTLPSQSPYAFLLLSRSHRLYAFAPFSIFSLLPIPLPLTSSLCQIQYVRSLISWGNRRKSTLTSLFIYIHIHTFSSSLTICPSTTSDQASKCNCLTT